MPKQEAPKIPEELKAKFKEIKQKLDRFKTKVVKEFDKYIVGIALLPPKKEDKKDINVFVLFDDSDSKKMAKLELKAKLVKIIDKFADDIDKNLKPQVMILTELKESCYDGKYEILQLIAMSAPVYDPKEMLGAIKIAEVHKSMVLKKFEKYIMSYVAAGSLFRGDKIANDIDVYIVVDDTDVKKMSRFELKDKLRAIIISQGYQAKDLTGIKKQFHIQVYILTDFWDAVKDAHPVMFTLLRDGVPLYDRGLFNPWRLLLQMGRIKPSPEAIDMQMDVGEKLLSRINLKLLGVVTEDLYYATLNPAQAALMLYGVNPPTPEEAINLLDSIFVKKEKLLEAKYVNILREIRDYYKKIEHGKIKEVQGKDLDRLISNAKDYLERIKKLFKQLEKRKETKGLQDVYEACSNVIKDAIKAMNLKSSKNVVTDFKAQFVDKGYLPERYLRILKRIVKSKNQKLTKAEKEKLRREARLFIKAVIEFVQRRHRLDVERSKIAFKYGSKFGELYLLGKEAFIIKDSAAKEKEILKANVSQTGKLSNLKKSSSKEFQDSLEKIKEPSKIFIKKPLFEDLKRLFGKEVEILY